MAGEKIKNIIKKKKIKKRKNERRGLTGTLQQLMPILMTLCMHDRRILHFDWVHLTNLIVFSVLAGAKYKRGDGQDQLSD